MAVFHGGRRVSIEFVLDVFSCDATKNDLAAGLGEEKPCGERSIVLSLSKPCPGRMVRCFDRLNLPDWELEIRKAVCEIILLKAL